MSAEIRSFMEPRFDYDFSRVRVHADSEAQASAAAKGALAYTEGSDVVFGAGQYEPDTVAGRWLIAHELAHVIQQDGAGHRKGASAGNLEREAADAGMHVALGGMSKVPAALGTPRLQMAAVSSGGFGQALEDYTKTHTVSNRAVTLLTKSPTFMGMVSTLDSNYVWLHDPRFSTGLKPGKASELELGPDGRATAPGFARGMRAMFVTTGGGARFTPAGAPPEFRSSDMISIDSPDTATFVDEIAHEATHATDFVSGSAPSGKTVADEIKAGIQLEIHARENEAQVLKEIPGKDIKAKSKEVGSRDVPEVERQVAEGLGATYLETAFFTRELHDAQVAEKLDETQAGKIRAEIDDLFGSVVLKPNPGYGQTWFEWKKVIRDWTEFNQKHSPSDSTFIADREKLVQDHAKRYFKGKVAYTPFPPSKP